MSNNRASARASVVCALALAVAVTGCLSLVAVSSAPPAGREALSPTSSPTDSGSRVSMKPRRVGFSPGFDLLYARPEVQRADMRRMRSLGVRHIRLDVGWAQVEADPDRRNWALTDRAISNAARAGLRVLAVVSYQPGWARTADGSVDPVAYAQFLGRAVERYRGKVDAWEIWNEPNMDWSWGSSVDPGRYADLVRAAVQSARRADPRARLVVGALAPAADAENGAEMSPVTFLDAVLRATRGVNLDAVSVHPYTYPAFPGGQEPWNAFFALKRIHEVMRRHGYGSTPVWLTEYGAPTGKHERAVTPREQARLVRGGLREAARLPFVRRIYLFSFRDAGADRHDLEDNFGLVTASGRAKPAYRVVRRELRKN
jgi:polysaccharide biosynthesis protein PslG